MEGKTTTLDMTKVFERLKDGYYRGIIPTMLGLSGGNMEMTLAKSK